MNLHRKSFFEFLPGPNSNRFVKFNDMPSSSSKYAMNSSYTRATPDIGRQSTRDAPIIGVGKESGKNLCDYDIQNMSIADS